MKVKQRVISEKKPPFIVAEISANHNNNLNRALKLVYEAKRAGADAVKIQTYTADTMTIDCDADDAWKIESIFLCNTDATNSCTADIDVSANNGTNYYYLCKGLVIPPATTISIIDRPLFMDETDIIRGWAGANGDIDWVISGTFMTD